jgi:kynurenine formamidase
VPWLRERGVALIGADTANDVVPSGYTTMPLPVHVLGLVALGLWLLDNADLEALASTAAELKQWDFLFTLAPLRLTGATGAPVNPVAVF